MRRVSLQLNPAFPLRRAWGAFVQAFSWQRPDMTPLSMLLSTERYTLLNTARSGLGLVLDALTVPAHRPTVALPAFICIAVALPFLHRGYAVRWIDTDDWGLLDPQDFAHKAAGCHVVVCPWVFGQRPDIPTIAALAQEHGVTVVEDCAHGYSTTWDGAAYKVLSFGREKWLSCVAGGAVLAAVAEDGVQMARLAGELPMAGRWWQLQHAWQPLLLSIAQAGWSTCGGVGKAFAAVCARLGLLPRAVYRAEKQGQSVIPLTRMGRAQQQILALQAGYYTADRAHSEQLSQRWEAVLSPHFGAEKVRVGAGGFRVVVRTRGAQQLREVARQHGYDLREWDGMPLSPAGSALQAFGYTPGACPRAEQFAREYVTLPTNARTTLSDIDRFARTVLPDLAQLS